MVVLLQGCKVLKEGKPSKLSKKKSFGDDDMQRPKDQTLGFMMGSTLFQ